METFKVWWLDATLFDFCTYIHSITFIQYIHSFAIRRGSSLSPHRTLTRACALQQPDALPGPIIRATSHPWNGKFYYCFPLRWRRKQLSRWYERSDATQSYKKSHIASSNLPSYKTRRKQGNSRRAESRKRRLSRVWKTGWPPRPRRGVSCGQRQGTHSPSRRRSHGKNAKFIGTVLVLPSC